MQSINKIVQYAPIEHSVDQCYIKIILYACKKITMVLFMLEHNASTYNREHEVHNRKMNLGNSKGILGKLLSMLHGLLVEWEQWAMAEVNGQTYVRM